MHSRSLGLPPEWPSYTANRLISRLRRHISGEIPVIVSPQT